MGNHFREPDTFVQFTPETRERIVQAIEGLVDLLDQCDGESDFEDDGSGEPWLGHTACELMGCIRPGQDDREMEDEHDEENGDAEHNGDNEPWLSSTEAGSASQANWGSQNGGLDYEQDSGY